MPLRPDEVETIAHLARLSIDQSLIPDYARNLSAILSLVEQMNTVDTSGVKPMTNPLDAVQRLRPDAVTEGDRREAFQAIAPATEDGLYLVPRVIE
ncbi:MAG TPA: Asp-tRNA(Asn)/Glu-tRNA(Gln) amidotransferase subunit GatC [Gammaproteobacteria bacterium]|nr:Asp-tRNA(Asn)/Glu-tRNA(Gln) amidotransferase subunit GatC [Gammaproteobacteria bacterium]